MPTTPALSFLHAGQLITNPFLSPDGLHPVDPVQAYGFEEHQTGGGCTALVRALENGQRLMLTEVDGWNWLPWSTPAQSPHNLPGKQKKTPYSGVFFFLRLVPGVIGAPLHSGIPQSTTVAGLPHTF